VGVGRTVNGTLTLSGPAPAGGVVVALSANPTGIVTLPATVPIQGGNTTGNFTVTGAAPGLTTIQASAPGFNISTVSINVTLVGAIQLTPNVTVGPTLST